MTRTLRLTRVAANTRGRSSPFIKVVFNLLRFRPLLKFREVFRSPTGNMLNCKNEKESVCVCTTHFKPLFFGKCQTKCHFVFLHIHMCMILTLVFKAGMSYYGCSDTPSTSMHHKPSKAGTSFVICAFILKFPSCICLRLSTQTFK